MTHPKNTLFDFQVAENQKEIHVQRSFAAPLDLVWAAWTEADLLDRWWAPKPYQNETRSMDFREGGMWHYAMKSPEGERHWCFFRYEHIDPMNRYSGHDGFCDENAAPNASMPSMHWTNQFENHGAGTLVRIKIQFQEPDQLQAVIDMGFKEGFTMGLTNLDAYIEAQFYLRSAKKPGPGSRVTTYLNFPGTAAQAMDFYKTVFRSEFVGGVQRFGDLPAQPGAPALSKDVQNMILHVELPILGGKHLLMATDAPAEMGFTVTHGNNMHISLETETRAETEHIFHALSVGGQITSPLQDMFWGAYFGSFTDAFGINWMVQCLKPLAQAGA